jgi:hypothetical protein
MNDRPVHSIQLANGLRLALFDRSIQIAGDRYRIMVEAAIEIPVSLKWWGDTSPPRTPSIEEIRATLGDPVIFRVRRERNFIDQNEKSAVFQNLCDVLLASANYYAHPRFPARFLLKSYAQSNRQHAANPGSG